MGKVGWIVGAIVGLVLVALGFGGGYGIFPSIIDGQVETNLNFWDETTDARQNFEKPLVDIYMKIWVYNVTNPDDVIAGKSAPNVVEVGPYVYKEERRKKFRQPEYIDSTKVQYGQEKTYHFDEGKSCEQCHFDAKWTVINAPMVGVTHVLRSDPIFVNLLKVINKAITTGDYAKPPSFNITHNDDWLDTLFMQTTVDDFIFNGVIPGFLQFIFDEKKASVGSQLPETVIDPETGFAALCNKNGSTTNEWYEAWTGTGGNLDKFLQFNKWGQKEGGPLYDDLTRANWWTENGGINGSNACNLLKGSDGQQFPPFVREDDIFHVFASDICRTIFVTFQNEQDIEGIKALRFSPPPAAFQVNTTANVGFCMEVEKEVPWNECYKTTDDPEIYNLTECFNHEKYTGSCHDGLLDITKCKQNAPAIISNPHFYQSPDFLRQAISGLSEADPEKHETRIDIEPYTGTTIRAHSRIQFNIPVKQFDVLDCMKNINDTIMPMFWVDEGADIDQENIDKIKSKLVTPILLLNVVQWTLIVLGFVITISCIAMIFISRRNAGRNRITPIKE